MTAVRFAPSPTGYLHVGNARQAIANYLFARRHGGAFLLRIDDTDTERSRPEYAEAIEQDLAWLGIVWNERFRQSDRLARYEAEAARLKQSGRLYPCFESEEELRARREARLRRKLPPVYDRAALTLTEAQREAAIAAGRAPHWRFKLSDGSAAWDDLVLGRRELKLATLSDPVLIRADGTPLYTFTSVVDDADAAITHVIRGEDHVTNTAAQIDIFRALGSHLPRFGHLPLLVDSDGGKLSKRLDSLSLRGLRHDGIEPTALGGYLARLGTAHDPAPLPLGAIATAYDLAEVSRSPARFDMRQLLALNARVLRDLDYDAVRARLPEGATEAFWLAIRGNIELLGEARLWWDVVGGRISPPVIVGEGAYLSEALRALPDGTWAQSVWHDWTETLKQATGRRGRALYHPLRLALTGEEQGPEMRLLLPLLGRERAVERLRLAACQEAVSGVRDQA